MTTIPELSDDTVIYVAREGGFAWIPKQAKPRRIALNQMCPPQRERICHILRQALPLGTPPAAQSPVGRGDQRYYCIEISDATQNQAGNTVIVIPEHQAPPELIQLWKEAE
ncbi:MAG TPA: protealysin inhibitor emfourin [Xylella taiwanensis]